ncbi:cyclic nucleotide-binding domain-containing protein [Chitinophaga varians]|uniref:cyclic nucleotide-binding domain-containing protein n=1 Tax=Chitinophaga varians TaxID=2202339 RepID=UPI00165FB5C3|nr:cyclic nucleotide-binding domain-containing protein [Chitinophaga varians]MBC9911938.1 cyclic nucleotide-binding domain-containing protein [Chitinophaga varians]
MHTLLLISTKKAAATATREMLMLQGYEVLSASDGKSGIAAARLHLPDLILCEMAMDGTDGLAVLELLRQDPRFQPVPFIMLADKYEPHAFRTAMNQGADDYMVKPYTSHDLVQTIANRLKRKALLHSPRETERDFKSVITRFLEDRNTIRAAAHEEIYREGGTPRYLYYLLSGKVKTIKTHEDGKDLVIGLYNTGDFFGYIALLEEETYKATAVVMEDAEIALIPKDDATALFDHSPLIIQRFVRLLARNVTEKEERLLGIAYDTLRKKVASALIHLRNKYQVDRSANYTIDIARDELAALAGTATESLIRTLSEFRSEKLIAVKGSSITLQQPGRLEEIAYH